MDFDILEEEDRLSIVNVATGGSLMTIIGEDVIRTLDDDDIKTILLSVFEVGYTVGRQVEKYDNSNS